MIIKKRFYLNNEIKWRKKFAIFPKVIDKNYTNQQKTIVWLGFYYQKCIYDSALSKWLKTNKQVLVLKEAESFQEGI